LGLFHSRMLLLIIFLVFFFVTPSGGRVNPPPPPPHPLPVIFHFSWQSPITNHPHYLFDGPVVVNGILLTDTKKKHQDVVLFKVPFLSRFWPLSPVSQVLAKAQTFSFFFSKPPPPGPFFFWRNFSRPFFSTFSLRTTQHHSLFSATSVRQLPSGDHPPLFRACVRKSNSTFGSQFFLLGLSLSFRVGFFF